MAAENCRVQKKTTFRRSSAERNSKNCHLHFIFFYITHTSKANISRKFIEKRNESFTEGSNSSLNEVSVPTRSSPFLREYKAVKRLN